MPRASIPRAQGSAPVNAVLRTMETLERLAGSATGVTVAELAEAIGVEKSVASRLLSSLMSLGYLIRDSTSDRYELSLKLISLATRQADRIGFPGVLQPVLERLSEATGELVQLSVVEDDGLVLAANAQVRKRALTILPMLGSNVAPHATASGKAWLASLGDHVAVEIALRHGLRPLTPRTITEVPRLLDELRATTAQGYAKAEGEFTEDVSAVAVPIGGSRFGSVIGTVAVSAPTSRLGPDDVERVLNATRDAAAELESIWPAAAVRLALSSRPR